MRCRAETWRQRILGQGGDLGNVQDHASTTVVASGLSAVCPDGVGVLDDVLVGRVTLSGTRSNGHAKVIGELGSRSDGHMRQLAIRNRGRLQRRRASRTVESVSGASNMKSR